MADERVEVGSTYDDVAAVVDAVAERVEDGGIAERQRAARPARGKGPGSGGVAVAFHAPTRQGDSFGGEDHRLLGGWGDDECLDDPDARFGCGAGRPCGEVQWRENVPIEDLLGGVGGVPDRAGRHAEHDDGARAAAIARGAEGDPWPRPAER